MIKILRFIGINNKHFLYIINIKNKIYNKINIILNFITYKLGNRTFFHYTLRKKILNDKEQFGVNNFYQSYPPLNIEGDRNTLTRFKQYELKKYLNNKVTILDIGGNLCFFSLYCSRFVNKINIIEYNKNLCIYGNALKKEENIKNVDIINIDFKKYETKEQYNIVFSFAIHMWVGMKFIDYLQRIHELLKDDGILFLESQNLNSDNFEENLGLIKDLFNIIKIKDSNDHKNIKRKIAILKKI